MPTIEIDISERIQRHLAAARVMSFMVFPDDAERRSASEITFRTILADWYAGTFAKLEKKVQKQVVRRIGSKLGEELPRAVASPAAWLRKRIFDDFLKPAGGVHSGALALTGSPSVEELKGEWTRRWWPIIYTGKLIALIGSIDQHHREVGASVNKAIHILCQTEGNDKQRMLAFQQSGFPGVYESSLKKAWARFKPVAHLCAAYVTTETYHYEQQLTRDFGSIGRSRQPFITTRYSKDFALLPSLRKDSQLRSSPCSAPLISKEEIFSLPDEIFEPGITLPSFRSLTEEEVAALKTYRAPKSFV